MKILQIAPPWYNTPPNGYGGTEWVVSNLTEQLVAQGHDVTLFATGKSKTKGDLRYVFDDCLRDMNIPWGSVLPSLLHYHQAFALGYEYDIIHVHLSSDTDIALLPFLSNFKQPYVLTHHSRWPFDKSSNMNEYYLDYYTKGIKTVHISKSMNKTVPGSFETIGVVYNGISFDTLTFNPQPKGDYLTWLGTIEPNKGVKEIIKIVKRTGDKLIFAGKVDPGYKWSYEYFNEEIKPMIDDDQIKFLGPADAKMRNELIGNAKAFLNHINWDEPFGMVMAESMACGTPVISINRGAAPELIIDGKTGFLVKDKEEMIDAIAKIDQIKREDCRKHVEDNFSAEAMARNYTKIYEEQIAKFKSIKV